MTPDQVIIIAILILAMFMFIWGKWRYDLVAGGTLLLCVYTGLVSGAEAFMGFGNPAVVTVACVLVLSYGLKISGAVDALAQRVLPTKAGPTLSITILTALAAVLSGFMNNVATLALLMPMAIQIAGKQKIPAGRVLMPLAFGSILGGMTTMIGTPPNLIISGYRAETELGAYRMFDFTPVGAVVAIAGVIFLSLIGWRLVPKRESEDTESFDTGTYLTEVRIDEGSKAIGKTLREVETTLVEADAQIVGMVRNDLRVIAPNFRRILHEGDILIIEVAPESLASALSSLGLNLEENVPPIVDIKDEEEKSDRDIDLLDSKPKSKSTKEETDDKKTRSEETVIQEFVVMQNSNLIDYSASDIRLRTRFGINLLAISRQGRRSIKRLRSTLIQAGDVLLMQGSPEALSAFASDFNCVPLAVRKIFVPVKGKALTAALIMIGSIALTAFGLLPVEIAFATGVIGMIVGKIIPARSIYQAIDWSVIILLGAMLPVAGAVASTGTADLISRFFVETVAQGHTIAALAIILIVTMLLTDIMNNAATAALMCPIALSTAAQLSVNPDTFLMGVAIGASCSFLTPIGHQNNTLILGPGGFKFGDYWPLGLPMEIIVVAVSLPALLYFWPL